MNEKFISDKDFIKAALFHDIGKLVWRAVRKGGRHEKLSADFIDAHPELFEQPERVRYVAASHHHRGEFRIRKSDPGNELADLIRLADRLSSGERRHFDVEEEGEKEELKPDHWGTKTPFYSVFPLMKLQSESGDTDESVKNYAYHDSASLEELIEKSEHHFPFKLEKRELNKESSSPVSEDEMTLTRDTSENQRDNYIELYKELDEQIRCFTKEDDIGSLLDFLHRMLWAVPSSTCFYLPWIKSLRIPYRGDVSLYDHMKTTAAIALCLRSHNELLENAEYRDDLRAGLYHYGTDQDKIKDQQWTQLDEKRFRLIGGDMNGIQKYIYGIAQPASVKGVAKRLRGRSFYVSALLDRLAHRIIEGLSLSPVNLLYCSGGRFYVLAPNVEKEPGMLDGIIEKVEKGFKEAYYGELGLTTAYIDLSPRELVNYNDCLDRLNKEINVAKSQKFIRAMTDGDSDWRDFTQKFNRSIYGEDDDRDDPGRARLKPCSSCGLHTASSRPREDPDDAGICDECFKQKQMGGLLVKSDILVHVRYGKRNNKAAPVSSVEEKESFPYPQSLPINEKLWLMPGNQQSEAAGIDEAKALLLEKWKEGDIQKLEARLMNDPARYLKLLGGTGEKRIAARYGFLSHVVPAATEEMPEDKTAGKEKLKPGDVVDFSRIADLSEGDKLLGILRMDVDLLGLAFSLGLDRENPHQKSDKSISRLSTMSRMLELFFGAIVDNICLDLSEKYRDGISSDDSRYSLINGIRGSIFYVAYSGGDDLFIIGPASEIPGLAYEIHRKFTQFTAQNPDWTISAGISFCKPKYPVKRFAHETGELLDRAKSAGRNRVAILDRVVRWKEYDDVPGLKELMEFGEKMKEFIDDGKMPRNLAHQLLRLTRVHALPGGEDYSPRIIPAIIYRIRRNVGDLSVRNELLENLVTGKNSIGRQKYMTVPCNLALMRTRRV